MSSELIAFMSPYTGAEIESRREAIQVIESPELLGTLGQGITLIRELAGFPDGVIVYSDGRIEREPPID